MKSSFIIFLAVCMIPCGSYAQMKIEGITLPASLKAGNTSLLLNGGGIREKFFLDLYVGGLYLKSKSSDAEKIIKSDEPMAIRIHIISSLITSEKMIDAVNEGFKKSTKGNTAPIQQQIGQFKKPFADPLKIGDEFDLTYVPGEGVKILKNGTLKETITGPGFKQAMFGIWLCDEPADEDLKEGMLGGD